MTFPPRLKFALFLIRCMLHAHGTSVVAPTAGVIASLTVATNLFTTTHNVAATYISTPTTKPSPMVVSDVTTSGGGSHNTGTPMMATTIATTAATVASTSTTHNAINLSSAYAHITSTPVTTSTSMTTMRNVSFSIGSISPPDCKSCSIGGTITVTMSCSIEINGSDEKCDKQKFNGTSCDYVTLGEKGYSCAEVKKNYANYVEKKVNIEKDCDDVCPASGSVLSPHIVFVFASGLVVGMLSQTL